MSGEKVKNSTDGGGAVYCFGLFGALYYFISTASSLGDGLLGIIKAIFWPAVLVFHLMKSLNL